jgi:hypothetical protein
MEKFILLLERISYHIYIIIVLALIVFIDNENLKNYIRFFFNLLMENKFIVLYFVIVLLILKSFKIGIEIKEKIKNGK